jgi:preprotein translocase subunit YajC
MLPRHVQGGVVLVELLAQEDGQTGGSLITLALPVLMIVGFYFLLIRPQRTRQKAQQALLSSLEVGDEVMTTGGIFGTIVEIDEDEGTVVVEIAPGTRIRMLRQGISQRFVEEEEEEGYDQGDTEETDHRP